MGVVVEKARVDQPVSIRLLGPVQLVRANGETIDFPSSSQRRLVALLSLSAGRVMRPDYLSDQLGVSPGALRKTVARLRARLEPDILHTCSNGYRIDGDVDAHRFAVSVATAPSAADPFAALEAALGLWVGAALDEFCHEPWAEAEAIRLEELRAHAIDRRCELLIDCGRSGEAVAGLHAHIANHPTRDRPRGLLLRALAADGRKADALRAYQQYRTFLAEELGMEPSTAVVDIERKIAQGWDGRSLDLNNITAAHPTAAASPLHSALANGTVVVGRQRQLLALHADAANATAGALRTVALSGEAGIGKTTLLGAFARSMHEAGGTVLYGRCDEGTAVPMQPFHSVVDQLIEAASTELVRAHTDRFGGALRRLAVSNCHAFSALQQLPAVPSPGTDDAGNRFELFEATADIVGRVADAVRQHSPSPLTIILDDLHWAEPTALLLLRHLVRASVGLPLLLVISYRDSGERKSDELRAALSDLDRGANRRIPLIGLNDTELAELATSLAKGPLGPGAVGLVAHLSDETAGNPLYATQLVAHLLESGRIELHDEAIAFLAKPDGGEVPPSLRDVVWSRVRAIGADAPEVLSAASVLGVEFHPQILAEMVNMSMADVSGVLDGSIDAGLLVELDDGAQTLRFTHALVAHALYSDLRGLKRSRLHSQAAAALLKQSGGYSQMAVMELARHSALAGQLSQAQHWAIAAGDFALDHLAPIEATRWFVLALDYALALDRPESELAERTLRLGEAQHHAGDPLAHATLLEAATIAQRCGAHDVVVRSALADDREFMLVGSVDRERLEHIESALAVCDRADINTYARLLSRFARELIHTTRHEERHRAAADAIALADASTDPTLLVHVARPLLFALWSPDTIAMRYNLAIQAAKAADRTTDPFLQFRAHHGAFVVAVESADAPAARHAKSRIDALAVRMHEPRLHWMNAILNTFEATMGGRLVEADAFAAKAFELATELGDTDAFTIYATQIFVGQTFAGRHLELFDIVRQAKEANPDVVAFQIGYGIICVVAGRPEEAQRILDAGARDNFVSVPNDYLWKTTTIGFAILAIELGDVGAASLLYPILEPFGREVSFNSVTSQGCIAAYLGKLASLLGYHDLADAHLDAALGIANTFGWEYHRATTLVALTVSRIRRLGALDDEAKAWLAEASAICEQCGLASVAAQVETLITTLPRA